MKLRAVELERTQLGWCCTVWFTAFGAQQYTAQEYMNYTGGRFILTALYNGVRLYWREAARIERCAAVQRQIAGW